MAKIDKFRRREWTEDVADDSPLAGEVATITVRSLNRCKVNASQADAYASMREARGDLYDAWREDIASRNERLKAKAAEAKARGEEPPPDEDETEKTFAQIVQAAGHHPDTLARTGVVRLDDEGWPTDDTEVRALVDELPPDIVDYLAYVVAWKNGIVKEREARPTDSPAS